MTLSVTNHRRLTNATVDPWDTKQDPQRISQRCTLTIVSTATGPRDNTAPPILPDRKPTLRITTDKHSTVLTPNSHQINHTAGSITDLVILGAITNT